MPNRRPKDCISEKYKAILLTATLSMMIEYIVQLSDNIIVGNLLGEGALSAITLVAPVFTISVFFDYLFALGPATLVAYAIGRGDKEAAGSVFSQALILEVAAGAALTGIFLLFRDSFMAFQGVMEDIRPYWEGYYNGILYLPVFQGLNALFYLVVMDEGGDRTCNLSSAVQVVSNIALSVALCFGFGTLGVAAASVISNVLSDLVLLSHFLRSRSQLDFRWAFDLKIIPEMVQYSFNDASSYLYLFLLELIISAYLVRSFSPSVMVVFSVVVNLLNFMVSGFDGVGEALRAIVCVYQSEGNERGKRKIMGFAMNVAFAESMFALCVMVFGSAWLPRLFGITSAEQLSGSAFAVRVFAAAAFGVSGLRMLSAYYLYCDRRILSYCCNAALFLLMIPAALLGGTLGGVNGVWVGLTLAVWAALAGAVAAVRFRYGRGPGLLLLDRARLEKQLLYDVEGTREQIMAAVYQAEEDMAARGIAQPVRARVELMMEETGMLLLERNHGREFYIEYSILPEDKLVLVVRDNGVQTDTAGEDGKGPGTLLAYTANMLIMTQRHRYYVRTGGMNRQVFSYEYEIGKRA